MTNEEAEELIRVWARKTRNKDDYMNPKDKVLWNGDFSGFGRWAVRQLVPMTLESVTDAMAAVLSERFKDFSKVLHGAKSQGVAGSSAPRETGRRSIRLPMFEDGDYVVLNPPNFPPWANALPGGRVRKQAHGDWIEDIPLRVEWENHLGPGRPFIGYHLMSCPITDAAELQHVILMSDQQRENWILGMDALVRDGQLSKFSKPRAHSVKGE